MADLRPASEHGSGEKDVRVYEEKAGSDRIKVGDGHGEPERRQEQVLHRGLSSRQVSMIAIGGAVGTGLIVGSGTALARGGPLGLFLAYLIMGVDCFLVISAMGEMCTYLPHRKGFSGYASRFVDEAFGFATGYNYWFKYIITTPNNIVVSSVVTQYWSAAADVNVAAFISVFLVVVLVWNFLGIRFFGELEFWLSLVKVLTIIGILIMCICLTSGANPQGRTVGFEYWRSPSGPFAEYKSTGSLGRFLGFWSNLSNALFAYIGTELIGVTVGETSNPRKNVPNAINKTFFRILIFYVGGVFCLGLVVASNDPELFIANKASTSAAASPFVVAVKNFGVTFLPGFLNALILVFTISAANSDLYIASRTLYAISEEGHAFRFFTRVNKMGVPYIALTFSWLFCFLAFMRVSKSGATVFGYFTSLVSIFGGITWCCILVAHIRFVRAFKAQGVDRSILRYRAVGGLWGSYIALFLTALVVITKGWDSFTPSFSQSGFWTNYVGILAFAVLYAGYKLIYRTPLIPLTDVDLFTGVREIDDDEAYWKQLEAERGPLNWWQRIVDKFV